MKLINIHGITNMEPVPGGTDEWYWATDYIHGDLYEAEELFRQGHQIQCNRMYLIHYPDGAVYKPIPPAAGQYFGNPVYDNGAVALLMVNFSEGFLHILRFTPPQNIQEAAQIPLSSVKDCYNLLLHTAPLSLTRQPHEAVFELIWPKQVRFAVDSRETLNFLDGDKLYFNRWHEDPDYWEETIVRSAQDGTILNRFPGNIRIMPNGERWHIQ